MRQKASIKLDGSDQRYEGVVTFIAPDEDELLGKIHVGTGTVEWGPESDPTQFNLTCDASNPCRLSR